MAPSFLSVDSLENSIKFQCFLGKRADIIGFVMFHEIVFCYCQVYNFIFKRRSKVSVDVKI